MNGEEKVVACYYLDTRLGGVREIMKVSRLVLCVPIKVRTRDLSNKEI